MPIARDERGPRRKGKNKKINEANVARDVMHEISDWRMSWENKCWIFVTTVQSVLYNIDWYRELMSKGTWLTFFDEYHKLNAEEGAKWGKAAEAIKGDVVLGLTATPIRSDYSPTIFNGLPVDVTVSFEQAYNERAIRGVVAHVEHYFVDMRGPDGETMRITTEDLRNVTTDWDSYQAKRGLRFTDGYLAGILAAAHDC